jgi:hypothetical protein
MHSPFVAEAYHATCRNPTAVSHIGEETILLHRMNLLPAQPDLFDEPGLPGLSQAADIVTPAEE